MHLDLTPANLIAAYAAGIFPMADDAGEVFWLAPDPRTVIELGGFKISRSLRTTRRRGTYSVTVSRAFEEVIERCADREEGTWISDEIRQVYCALHRLGFAHSVEAWRGDELCGGLYGVVLGGAFFGESMFHTMTDASKVALVHLVERMVDRGFTLLDLQFMTEHLQQFGAVEITREEYERRLRLAITLPCTFVDETPTHPANGDPRGAQDG